MIAQVVIENGQKKIKPLTADAGAGAPVGSFIYMYKKSSPSGYLYCDGSTFDETAYPALYLYLGSNVLPDYREYVMVGKAVYVYIKATSGLAENQQENVLNATKDYVDNKTKYNIDTKNLQTGWNNFYTFEGLNAGTYVITVSINTVVNDINAIVGGVYSQIGVAGTKNGTLIMDIANDNTDMTLTVYTNNAATGVTLRTVLMKVA